ncbi:MAG TPA: hypothetical protein VD931_06380, partial [Baekduia sp.]|nr:hypothetical protein [Baekduia sp.]
VAARGGRLALGRGTRLSRRAALRRGALRLAVSGGGARLPVRIRVVRRTRRATVLVAARRLTTTAGPARPVTVPLTAAGRRLLRRHAVLRLVVTARSGSSVVRRTITVRR